MQNRKLILALSVILLLTGAAAFIAGRMLNPHVGPLAIFGFGGKGGMMGTSIDLIPAREIPWSEPQVVGLFSEQVDNVMVVQATSLKTGGQGIVMQKADDGEVSPSLNMDYGPGVEVILTNETIMYRDTTPPIEPASAEITTVQQTVEATTPDQLAPGSYVSVWGRKSGDRIIAEVVLIHVRVLSR